MLSDVFQHFTFTFTFTFMHLYWMLTARDVACLSRWRSLEACCRPRTRWYNDATAFAGYASMMMMMMTCTCIGCCCTCVVGSVAEWIACWTQAQKALGSNRGAATLSGNSLRQTVHTHRASAHQAEKLAAALLRVARVTAGLVESNGSLPPGL